MNTHKVTDVQKEEKIHHLRKMIKSRVFAVLIGFVLYFILDKFFIAFLKSDGSFIFFLVYPFGQIILMIGEIFQLLKLKNI